MAAADELQIRIVGRGGHAALPQRTVDPVVAAAHVITALQTVVSRSCDPTQPAVLTFGKVSGGHARNVIPDEVVLDGTLRTYDEPTAKTPAPPSTAWPNPRRPSVPGQRSIGHRLPARDQPSRPDRPVLPPGGRTPRGRPRVDLPWDDR